jgi:hypothetical protein
MMEQLPKKRSSHGNNYNTCGEKPSGRCYLLDGGIGVNIIMEYLKNFFRLSILKPAPIPLGWETKP